MVPGRPRHAGALVLDRIALVAVVEKDVGSTGGAISMAYALLLEAQGHERICASGAARGDVARYDGCA